MAAVQGSKGDSSELYILLDTGCGDDNDEISTDKFNFSNEFIKSD